MRHVPCRLQPRPPCGGRQAEPPSRTTFTPQVTAAVTCPSVRGGRRAWPVCPVDAIKRTEEAIVVNEQTCIGCKLCAVVCPFGAIHPSGTSTAGVAGISYPTPTQPRGTSPLLAWSIGVYTCAVKCDLCSTLGPDEEPIASKRVRPRRSTCAMPRRSRAFARTRCAPPWRPTRS